MSRVRALRLKINHLTYSVRPSTVLHENVGLCDHTKLIIYILASEPPSEQARILLHEICHAFHHAYNIEDKERGEEAICEVLESPLAGLFRDNPHIAGVLEAAFAGKPIVA